MRRVARPRSLSISVRWSSALACAIVSLGCAEPSHLLLGRLAPATAGQDAAAEDAGPPALSWGAYAASLSDEPCPASAAADLVVSSTRWDHAGDQASLQALADPVDAGAELTLLQALWIAENRPGPDTIRFDAEVFASARRPRIQADERFELPQAQTELCLDARDREVVVVWPEEEDLTGSFHLGLVWHLGSGSVQYGVQLLHLPARQYIARGARAVACRYNTDGEQILTGADRWHTSVAHGAAFGPGNVCTNVIEAGQDSEIAGNSFGYDPASGRFLGGLASIWLNGGPRISDNVFVSQGGPLSTVVLRHEPASSQRVTLQRNSLGALPDGTAPPYTSYGLDIAYGGRYLLEGNRISHVATAMYIHAVTGQTPPVALRRNAIFANDRGVVYAEGEAPHAPPSVASAVPGDISGRCAVAGTVEVFADRGDQGEIFLGETSCDAAEPWHLAATAPAGMNLTAILTVGERSSAFSSPLTP